MRSIAAWGRGYTRTRTSGVSNWSSRNSIQHHNASPTTIPDVRYQPPSLASNMERPHSLTTQSPARHQTMTYLIRHDRLLEARAHHGALTGVLAAAPSRLAVGRLGSAQGLSLLDALLQHLVERSLRGSRHGVRLRDIGRRGLRVGVVGGHAVDGRRRLLAGVGARSEEAGRRSGARHRSENGWPKHCERASVPSRVVVGSGECDAVRRVDVELLGKVRKGFPRLAVGCSPLTKHSRYTTVLSIRDVFLSRVLSLCGSRPLLRISFSRSLRSSCANLYNCHSTRLHSFLK